MNFKAIIALTVLLATSAFAGNGLNAHYEAQIEPQLLATFSSTAVKLKECSECDQVSYQMRADTELFEKEQPIDLKRATELYLRRNSEIIFVGISQTDKTIDYINFGGYASDIH